MKTNVTLLNGEVISYVKKGNGKKRLILIHGNLSSGKVFDPITDLLGNDYEIYIPDLRGFGDSSYFRKVKSIGDFSQDILFFMKKLNIDKSNFIGWGTGGAVVMDFASKHMEKIEKIVLINSVTHAGLPIYIKDEFGKQAFGQVHKSIESLALDEVDIIPTINAFENQDRLYFEKLFKDKYLIDGKVEEEYFGSLVDDVLKQKNYVDVMWSLANFNLSHQHNFYAPGTNTINYIKNPVLHIWGELDKVIPEYMVSENIKAMYESSIYKKYSNTGHLPFLDVSEELVEDIKKFI